MSRRDDPWGQVDGDDGPAPNFVPYVPASAGQPWLRSPMPPWHLWGGTEIITASSAPGTPAQFTKQIVKLSYRRPETWHWLFAARITKLPSLALVAPGDTAEVTILFDLTVGIGRTMVQLPGFEQYIILWSQPAPSPAVLQQTIWSTQAIGMNRSFPTAVGDPVPNVVDQMVAQDLQLQARVQFAETVGGLPATDTVQVEVTAQFAPKTHIRPDWFLEGPPEQVFTGSETEGR